MHWIKVEALTRFQLLCKLRITLIIVCSQGNPNLWCPCLGSVAYKVIKNGSPVPSLIVHFPQLILILSFIFLKLLNMCFHAVDIGQLCVYWMKERGIKLPALGSMLQVNEPAILPGNAFRYSEEDLLDKSISTFEDIHRESIVPFLFLV